VVVPFEALQGGIAEKELVLNGFKFFLTGALMYAPHHWYYIHLLSNGRMYSCNDNHIEKLKLEGFETVDKARIFLYQREDSLSPYAPSIPPPVASMASPPSSTRSDPAHIPIPNAISSLHSEEPIPMNLDMKCKNQPIPMELSSFDQPIPMELSWGTTGSTGTTTTGITGTTASSIPVKTPALTTPGKNPANLDEGSLQYLVVALRIFRGITNTEAILTGLSQLYPLSCKIDNLFNSQVVMDQSLQKTQTEIQKWKSIWWNQVFANRRGPMPSSAFDVLLVTLQAHKDANFVVLLGCFHSDLAKIQDLMDAHFPVRARDVQTALEHIIQIFNRDFQLLFPQTRTFIPRPLMEGKVKCGLCKSSFVVRWLLCDDSQTVLKLQNTTLKKDDIINVSERFQMLHNGSSGPKQYCHFCKNVFFESIMTDDFRNPSVFTTRGIGQSQILYLLLWFLLILAGNLKKF
jgi:hypothetical protein